MSETQEAAAGLDSKRGAVIATSATLALAVLVYLPILTNMVAHWRKDPDYSHGFLVVPLAAYFAWEKRRELAQTPVGGSWWGLVPLAMGVFSLAVGQLGNLLTALRSGFVFTVIGLVLLILGWRIFRIVAFPLFFMFLMVPLPQSLVNIIAFPLQLTAARWAVDMLHLIGIPALVEGNIIHLAHSELFVAEACSGLRSLMALVTLGVVFAYFFKRNRPLAQVILVGSTIPIAVVVNAVRVAITGILTHHYGLAAAQGVIHEFQGIITFTFAFALLMGESRLLDVLSGFSARATERRRTN